MSSKVQIFTTTFRYNVSMNKTILTWDDVFDVCYSAKLEHKDFTQIPAVTGTLIVCYLLIMILAVFGNILVISTVWRNSHMQTVTNYYIVNLAISDFFVSSLVMPLKLLEYTAPCKWTIFSSDGLCSVTYYTLPIFVFTSVLTLVAISLERYYAIVHPLSALKVNSKSRTKKILAATWIIPIIVASPYVYCKSYSFTVYSELGEISRQICTDRFDEIDGGTGQFRKGFFILLFIVMYFIPMVVIVTTCTKIALCLVKPINIESSAQGTRDSKRRHEINKRKVAKMVIVVAAAFIISWSPQYVVVIVTQIQTRSFLNESNFIFTMLMTHLFGFINSCVNPFIYTAMSEKFRKSFSRTLNIVFCSYYCRQRLLRYRESLSTRRPTAVTSFVEPEEEPLQNESNASSRNAVSGRVKNSSHSSSSDSGSNRSRQSSRRGRRIEQPDTAESRKRVFIAKECIELEEFKRGQRSKGYNPISSDNDLLDESDDQDISINETSRMVNPIADNDCQSDSCIDSGITNTDSVDISESSNCLIRGKYHHGRDKIIVDSKCNSNVHHSQNISCNKICNMSQSDPLSNKSLAEMVNENKNTSCKSCLRNAQANCEKQLY